MARLKEGGRIPGYGGLGDCSGLLLAFFFGELSFLKRIRPPQVSAENAADFSSSNE